jgi:BlaI family transcriptional regulator, penicillinase repressor
MRLTASEWQIMNALWQQHPATAREIAALLPGNVQWAHTTIKTLLSRLAMKGAVRETKRGHVSLYAPLVTQEEARRTSLRALVKQAFGGTLEPFLSFLAIDKSLTPGQRRQLEKLLEEESKRTRGARK